MTDQEQPPNSALNVKLDYIQRDINEIKGDVKDIKKDYVSRMEFIETIKVIKEDLSSHKKLVYGLISILGVATVGAIVQAIMKLILK